MNAQLSPALATAMLPRVSPSSIVRQALGFQRCGCVAKTGEEITNDFIRQIEAGKVKPDHMAAVLYAMHAAMMDRYESIAIWIPQDLEQVADTVIEAIRIDEVQPA
jgi:hypothetical protein